MNRVSIPTLIFAILTCLFTLETARAAVPAAPSACYATTDNRTASSASISVKWTDNSTDETGWDLYYSDNGGSSYFPLGTVASATTAATGIVTGIPPLTGAPLNGAIDKAYRFIVFARNASGLSAASNIAMVGTYLLGNPINFNVTAVDPFNVAMSWEEGSTSELGFSIERRTGGGPWEILGTLGANNISLIPTQLTEPATSYSFRVRAYKVSAPTTPDSIGPDVSAYSNTVSLTSAAYPLTAAVVPCQRQVNLSWPNILNEAGYAIYFRSPPGDWEVLSTVAANVTSYQAVTPRIEDGKAYQFLILPLNGIGQFLGESTVAAVTVDGITSKTGTSDIPGASLSHTFVHNATYTVSSRTLTNVPSGLTFNNSTGTLSGVYPPRGNYQLTYTVTFTNGSSMSQVFHIRSRPASGPPAAATAIPAWTATAGTTRDTPLAGTFSDPEAESAVRVSTNIGNMDFILFDTATPATVANFMAYANSGKYTDVCFHRSDPGFVIQGGGFKSTGTGANFTGVATSPPVVNEPGIGNTRGTISMAKTGGDPNSATSQFFVSVNDNRANLDYQNGGFTVFGRVAGNGMNVADTINNLPTNIYQINVNGSPLELGDFPMNDTTAPAVMDQTKLVKILSVASIPTISHAVTGNTSPGVATAAIVGGQLRLTALAGGTTTITVTATDLDNLTASQTIGVTVQDTYTTWASRTAFPGNQNSVSQNPDGDTLSNLQEYAFFGSPGTSSQAQVPVSGSTGAAPGPRFMTLSFPVRKFTNGLTYVVEANNQLTGTWSTVWSSSNGFSHAQVVSAIPQSDRTQVTIKDTAAIGGTARRFMRVKVVHD